MLSSASAISISYYNSRERGYVKPLFCRFPIFPRRYLYQLMKCLLKRLYILISDPRSDLCNSQVTLLQQAAALCNPHFLKVFPESNSGFPAEFPADIRKAEMASGTELS